MSESFFLFLNSYSSSPYITNRISTSDVIFTINWDAIFNGNNYRYNKCKLRYDYYSNAPPLNDPYLPIAAGDIGVIVVNGFNSRSTSETGGMVLGLISIDGIQYTASVLPNVSSTQQTFTGSIPLNSTALTVSATTPTLLPISSIITYYNPNTAAYTTNTIAAIVGTNSYTLGTINGAAAVPVGTNMLSNSQTTSTFTTLKSSNIQSAAGQSIEVPKGMRTLEIQLCGNNYGQRNQSTYLLPTTTDWGLMLNFELYDPIDI